MNAKRSKFIIMFLPFLLNQLQKNALFYIYQKKKLSSSTISHAFIWHIHNGCFKNIFKKINNFREDVMTQIPYLVYQIELQEWCFFSKRTLKSNVHWIFFKNQIASTFPFCSNTWFKVTLIRFDEKKLSTARLQPWYDP